MLLPQLVAGGLFLPQATALLGKTRRLSRTAATTSTSMRRREEALKNTTTSPHTQLTHRTLFSTMAGLLGKKFPAPVGME